MRYWLIFIIVLLFASPAQAKHYIFEDLSMEDNSIVSANDIKLNSLTPDTDDITIKDDLVIIETSKTPSGTSDIGTTGSVAWDADYAYFCTATNHWERVALSEWGLDKLLMETGDVILLESGGAMLLEP
jgi:hypothetical protein